MKIITNIILCLVLQVPPALAQPASETQEVDNAAPVLFHVAPMALNSGDPAYRLTASMRGAWDGRGLELHYRTRGQSEWAVSEFTVNGNGLWSAMLSRSAVRSPGFEYFIQSVEADGQPRFRFASPDHPHLVVVNPNKEDRLYNVRKERHDNRAATVAMKFSHINFGQEGRKPLSGSNQDEVLLSDYYNTLEADLTYRFLRDSIYQISFGYGMIGGKLGAATPDREWFDSPNVPDSEKPYERPNIPGFYYGFASAYWEFNDWAGFEARVIMGASHTGFDGGIGALGRLGTVNGIHLDLGIETISDVGFKFTTEFQWDTVPNTRMSLRAVVTDYPTQGHTAVISSYNLTVLLGEVELYGSLGYGLREGHEKGGPVFSGGAAYNF